MAKSNHGTAKMLASLGGIVALIGFAISLVDGVDGGDLIDHIIFPVLGILFSLLVLVSVDVVKSKKTSVSFNWLMLLVLIVLQAYVGGFSVDRNFVSLGLLLEVIALILLIIDEL